MFAAKKRRKLLCENIAKEKPKSRLDREAEIWPIAGRNRCYATTSRRLNFVRPGNWRRAKLMVESNLSDLKNRDWLKPDSETVVGFVSFVLLALLAIVDLCAPSEVKLTPFYLLLIAIAAWGGGKKVGIAAVVTSSLMLLAREFKTAEKHSPEWASVWNMGMMVGIYLLA